MEVRELIAERLAAIAPSVKEEGQSVLRANPQLPFSECAWSASLAPKHRRHLCSSRDTTSVASRASPQMLVRLHACRADSVRGSGSLLLSV